MKYSVPHQFLQKRLKIAVVGVGGTGGEVMDALTRLDFGLKALGHPHGIHVTAFDADIVEPHNIGRQRFSESDVGQYKSIALTHRINMFYGTDWDAEPNFFEPDAMAIEPFDLIIGCVDKAAFRVQLGQLSQKGMRSHAPTLWLDMGNGKHSGQCVLGHVVSGYQETLRLPNVFDLYPDLANPAHDSDESTPRCSLAEALTGENGQDLFTNGTLATYSMNILWQLLTKGEIDHHGMTVDVQSLKSAPMPIDENAWAFYGYNQDIQAA
jgi:PRTRC genetic system ThiF family protein